MRCVCEVFNWFDDEFFAAEYCTLLPPAPNILSAVVPITVFLCIWLGVFYSSSVDLDGVRAEPVIIFFGVTPTAVALC
jgi:hypothetical protein